MLKRPISYPEITMAQFQEFGFLVQNSQIGIDKCFSFHCINRPFRKQIRLLMNLNSMYTVLDLTLNIVKTGNPMKCQNKHKKISLVTWLHLSSDCCNFRVLESGAFQEKKTLTSFHFEVCQRKCNQIIWLMWPNMIKYDKLDKISLI